MQIIERTYLENLFDPLKASGYDLFGPVARDGAIVYDQIDHVSDMPIGWRDHQEKGTYRLEKTNEPSVFAYAVGPYSWKKLLHPAEHLLWKAQRTDTGFELVKDEAPQKTETCLYRRSCLRA